MTADILLKVQSCHFKYNFKLLTCNKFLLYTQKTSFVARISNGSNDHISKNIFTKNHAIHLIVFIFTRVFKYFYYSVKQM